MENATKALLIAAAVLMAIVLIATGVLLIKNASGTSKQANETGELLSNATDKASVSVQGGLKEMIISKKEFNEILDKFSSEHSDSYQKSKIPGIILDLTTRNNLLKDQIKIEGYIYKKPFRIFIQNGVYSNDFYTSNDIESKKQNESKMEFSARMINVEIPKLLMNNVVEKLDNPLYDEKGIKEIQDKMYKVLKEINSSISKQDFINEFNKDKEIINYAWHFRCDETGYIDKAVYIVILNPTHEYIKEYCVIKDNS